METPVIIHTDGSCIHNPGPGGWAALLSYGGHEKLISGSSPWTTNNKMELTALIMALEKLKRPCTTVVYTDSRYVRDSIEKGWLDNWIKNKWIKTDKKPVANRDLWKHFVELRKIHTIKVHWIKGHNGHEENERVDTVARQESKKAKEARNDKSSMS